MKLYILFFVMNYGYCYDKHMTCKDIDGSHVMVASNSTGAVRGPPGVKGDIGFPGFPGPPGVEDMDRLNEIIAVKVEEQTQELKLELDELESLLQNTTRKIQEKRCTGVVYDGKCFWADVYSERKTDYYTALEQCRRKNYELANIYSERQYRMVMLLLAGKLELRDHILIWTGMRKKYKNDIAQLSDGTAAPFTKPREQDKQWKHAEAKRTHVYLQVTVHQGMGAIWPSYKLHGALCQYSF